VGPPYTGDRVSLSPLISLLEGLFYGLSRFAVWTYPRAESTIHAGFSFWVGPCLCLSKVDTDLIFLVHLLSLISAVLIFLQKRIAEIFWGKCSPDSLINSGFGVVASVWGLTLP